MIGFACKSIVTCQEHPTKSIISVSSIKKFHSSYILRGDGHDSEPKITSAICINKFIIKHSFLIDLRLG